MIDLKVYLGFNFCWAWLLARLGVSYHLKKKLVTNSQVYQNKEVYQLCFHWLPFPQRIIISQIKVLGGIESMKVIKRFIFDITWKKPSNFLHFVELDKNAFRQLSSDVCRRFPYLTCYFMENSRPITMSLTFWVCAYEFDIPHILSRVTNSLFDCYLDLITNLSFSLKWDSM